jgi:hypothetical protein
MALIPSANAIARLRRMTAATIDPKLTDSDLSEALVTYALADGSGLAPTDVLWVETFDYNRAAAEAWGWKAAAASALVDTNADGSQFGLSKIVANCESQRDYYLGQASWGTIYVTPRSRYDSR